MGAAKIEVGDIVVINDLIAGTVLDKFPSATGEDIYDVSIVTNWGVWRIAVLGSDVAVDPESPNNQDGPA